MSESVRDRLLAALEREEPQALRRSWLELALDEEPPVALDARVSARAQEQAAVVRVGLNAELERGEAAELGPVLKRLGLDEEPPAALDQAVLQAARRAVAPPAPARGRAGLAAAAMLGFAWLGRAVREQTFPILTGTMLAAAVIVTSVAQHVADSDRGPSLSVPLRQRETRWAAVEDPVVPRRGLEVTPSVATSTAPERTIAEALARGEITGLSGDGTLHTAPPPAITELHLTPQASAEATRAAVLRAAREARQCSSELNGARWSLRFRVAAGAVQVEELRAEGGVISRGAAACMERALSAAPWAEDLEQVRVQVEWPRR